ncbi:MAG: hypothetical protein HQL90_03965 [Magnetococcales bacterium]|nr:hypothetical protein [Magnetococcales bacterium]
MAHEPTRSKKACPAWSLTLVNVALLLLVIFIALLSASQSDPARAGQLMASLHRAFGVDGLFAFYSPASALLGRGDPAEFPQKLALLHQIGPLVDSNRAEVETTDEGFIMRIEMDALFQPDSLQLRPEIMPRLRRMAVQLASFENRIRVVGYSDQPTVPAHGAGQPGSGRSLALAYSLLSARGGKSSRFRPARSGDPEQQETAAVDGGGQGNPNPALAYASVMVTYFAAAGGVETKRLEGIGHLLTAPPAKVGVEKATSMAYRRRIEIVLTRERLPAKPSPPK